MVEITRRTVAKHRHESLIASPATSRDMCEQMTSVRAELEAAGVDHSLDNAFHIESHDDRILAHWDEDKVVQP